MTDSGEYSDELMRMALQQKTPFHFHGAPLHVDPATLYDPSCAGAVVHIPGHWVALRYVAAQGQVWLLDSKWAPRRLSTAEYEAYVQAHRDAFAVVHAERMDLRGFVPDAEA